MNFEQDRRHAYGRAQASKRRGHADQPSGNCTGEKHIRSGSLSTTHRQPPISTDISFLVRYGVSINDLRDVMRRSVRHGVSAQDELIASGVVRKQTYYQCLAHHLNLDFVTTQDLKAGRVTFPRSGITAAMRSRPRLFLEGRSVGQKRMVFAPTPDEISDLAFTLRQDFNLRDKLCVASPEDLRQACIDRLRRPLAHHAEACLKENMPSFSAFNSQNFIVLAAFLLFCVAAFYCAIVPTTYLTAFWNITLALIFFLSVSLRFFAALTLRTNKRAMAAARVEVADRDLPVYSIIAALYDETASVPGLLSSLSQLNWPKAKLDIKLVLEEDDQKTIGVARKLLPGYPNVDLLIVPKGEPQTKPRALNFALPLARGEFVVIYDAEDRPTANQLRSAYARFYADDTSLGCVQAPLMIDNANRRWLSTMFEIEYRSLFDGFLPALCRWRLPVLLGGTSNHFRTDVLRKIGAWDPYNVTEDADLGLRLKRFSHTVKMIDDPTYEEAPETFNIWLKQRTRWFKGWLQTTLVHVRRPKKAIREFSISGFIAFHLISTTLVISALVYPFFLLLLALQLGSTALGELPDATMLLGLNLAYAFLAYGLLSCAALAYRRRLHLWPFVLFLPVYWILLSVAAWRALYQFYRAPYHWEKTPHGLAARTSGALHQPVASKFQ